VPYTGVRPAGTKLECFAAKFLDFPFSAKPGETRKFRPMLFNVLVEPLAANVTYVAKGQKLPKRVPVSAILFGPPGTSKTEIVEQIANFIGWTSVTVDPSYFVKSGLDQIQAQANRIFRMLSAAEQLVVLFDEFDEMVRNRALSDELLSRLLTTSMLPKLARINKERRILFVVATNYIDSFDVAISRAGRFDLVLQMMPPLAEEKTRMWPRDLEALKAIVVDGDFDTKLGDLTFLETELLIRRFKALGDPANEQSSRDLWDEVISRCTLHRTNERAPRPQQAGVDTAMVEAERTPRGQGPMWKDTAIQEVEFIRLN
jgi:SpoVK/Ycf46/Vps4 family AAA+-type ATPase